ncbi:3-oxoacyl-[acyl-carrier-protein] synthase-1 [Aquimarina sp. EL_43]|uniref:beta-ketoacyl-[acyl-carrier-protein] synthase family protein n=1 Tax=unclassified Aquimarina TaxID=2627091 RepID=UPI0018C94120|nr:MULTISPECIES: beta-ketoacyl-[acyl-carrier-protein] synthase family protein [unclassified Aquimarina]MBG6130151.1 3-oxoacyl-[acyl-carrier-protein] synthase-1 [Aquimarina sp. EL_35]MBG6148931.1 3-oxoacyl-[acyl-carrier-protein] synthase-1 [Aquimarina sp. EL_32]MBG6168695.1 3-oxoacyl-[acyl-carrier-protein] synthase-1 [Aquimarina sp. EL_43]
MSKGVAITGMGIISAIGNNVAENYQSLINGKKGISRVSKINTIHKDDIMVGEIASTNLELEQQLGLTPDNNYSRTALLGAIAAKQAIQDARISDINAFKTGLVSATSVGGMDMTETYYYDYLENKSTQKYIEGHHAGDSTQKIAEQLGIEKSLVTTISTACSSAANAIMLGARLIKSGKLDRVIVGGSDCLSKFTINGFKTLMILSDTYNTPFDENRKGLNLGEAAAFLVLESDKVIAAEKKEVLGYVKGYGNANDAYHQTASSENGDGATLAMQKALKVAAYTANDIDYINAHGTATGNNDLSEGRAILRVFGEEIPDFSSTKAYTGHTLAAAGAIEAVYAVLALQHNIIYPNLNFKTQMKEFDITPQLELKEKELHTVLSNSLGFGGNCSTIIFSKEQ